MQNPFVAIDSRLRIIEEMLFEIKQTAQKQPQPQPTAPPDDPERLISKKEAARLLGCSQSTIDNYRRAGVLEAVKLGKAVRFRRGDVLAVVQPQNTG
jgi:excisionase family DNA binding protein